MATLKDIADICGVSTATVSYVLSGRGTEKRITEQTQQEIRKAAESLDYEYKGRNKAVLKYRVTVYFPLSGLKMLLPTFLDAFNRIVDAETSNIDILLRPYTQNQLHLQRELWAERKGSSAIVISPGGTDLANLAEKQTLVPVILLNRTLPNYSYVGFDQLESGRLAAEHALKRGGDSILLVSSPTLFGTSWRSSAFSDYCLQHGVNLEHSTISADTSIRAGYELGKALVHSNRLKKVICCTYDMTALGLTTALSEENIVVGKDVEILTTSSSDDDLLAYSNPPITVVDLKFRDLCYMAMRLGMDIATGRASYPQEISLHPTIIYRKSEEYLGVLSLPTLALELPVQAEWEMEALRRTPCRYAGTLSGDDLIIAAHNYRQHFALLHTLRAGDAVRFTDAAGLCHRYTVSLVEILDETAVEEMTAGEWDLTLFTCNYDGRARITVRCIREL